MPGTAVACCPQPRAARQLAEAGVPLAYGHGYARRVPRGGPGCPPPLPVLATPVARPRHAGGPAPCGASTSSGCGTRQHTQRAGTLGGLACGRASWPHEAPGPAVGAASRRGGGPPPLGTQPRPPTAGSPPVPQAQAGPATGSGLTAGQPADPAHLPHGTQQAAAPPPPALWRVAVAACWCPRGRWRSAGPARSRDPRVAALWLACRHGLARPPGHRPGVRLRLAPASGPRR